MIYVIQYFTASLNTTLYWEGIGSTVTLAREKLDVDSEDRWDPVGGEAKKYKNLWMKEQRLNPKVNNRS